MDHLIRDLEPGTVALTVNRRLSRHIVSSYDSYMQGAGLSFWRSPAVMPFSAWLDSVLDATPPRIPLLDPVRSKALWESVVEKDMGSDSPRIARSSYEALMLMNEFIIELPQDIYLTEEAKAFKAWRKAYDARLKSLGFTGPEKRAQLVLRGLRDGSIIAPRSIILAGFDELTPVSALIIDEMKRLGSGISFWPNAPGAGGSLDTTNVTIRPYADEAEEAAQAARWARANPGSRLGFIVPEIRRYRDIIIREFTSELDPAGVRDWRISRVFNISMGAPLSSEPVVAAAIAILSVTSGEEDIGRLFGAILTPYLEADEGYALTRLNAKLRNDNVACTSLHGIRKRLKGTGKPQAVIDGWIRHLAEARSRELPSVWADRFSRFLKRLGFPAAGLASREHQALKAWTELLGTFSRLDCITGTLTRKEAAARLKRLAADMIHQSETPESDKCAIQVMGLLEASGQTFDRVWLMGCHEGALPASPDPNPFIPLQIQKKAGLPHSSPEKETSFARSALGGLIAGVSAVQVSYPRTSYDGELNVSPLFRHVEPETAAYIEKSSRLKDAVNACGGLEEGPIDADIPVSVDESSNLNGGTAIIRNQSLCPFKAFATHRLSARSVSDPDFGLTPQQRGNAIHRALGFFWKNVRDSSGLKVRIEDNSLEKEIERAVEMAFARVSLPYPLSIRFIAIEKERLKEIMKDWLEVESRRADFAVADLEEKRRIAINGLMINGKPDRVDILADGRTVCIDYKTGNNIDRNDWLTERPRDPQLLIYASDVGVDAIAFAHLTPGGCGFIGTAKSSGILPDILPFDEDRKWKETSGVPDWEGMMDFWKRSLEALAGEFLGGVARVDPLGEGRELACNRCDFKALCRITEAEDVFGDNERDGN